VRDPAPEADPGATDPPAASPSPPSDLAVLVAALTGERASLDRELSEIELLIQQARNETERLETRRAKGEQRVVALEEEPRTEPAAMRDARAQLLTLTQRATMMQAQLEVLEGKHKTLIRYRDSLATIAGALSGLGVLPSAALAAEGDLPPVSRAVLSAQEDLRRDIARQMHDGPAQSLANIALQAEIVQRLITRDPALAQAEVEQLRGVVQHALDATKRFIFDVRPMVLDDLGLVPTVRRAATDRGRQAGLPIEFESVGPDRRLTPDLESGFFRIIDDATVGFLALHPTRIAIRLDWTDREVRATVRSQRPGSGTGTTAPRGPQPGGGATTDEPDDMPPALAAMIRQQRTDEATARTEAHSLPANRWRDIEARAATLGVRVSLRDDGQTLEAAATTP
jgi:two-component system, NarL family, sensor histidine kinase DegS